MPIYEFKCDDCNARYEMKISIEDYDDAKNSQTCDDCGTILTRYLFSPPGLVIPPHMQATGSKFKYYGIDPITGAGITEHTNVSDAPGIRIKEPKLGNKKKDK